MKIDLAPLLKQKGITLSELSRRTGVPKGTLSQWRKRSQSISMTQAKAVAHELGIGLHTLVFGKPDPNESIAEEVLTEIFSGTVKVTLHRVDKKKG